MAGFPISESSPPPYISDATDRFLGITRRGARVGKNNAGVSKSCGWDSPLEMDFREFSTGCVYIGGNIKSGRDSYKVILSESQLAVFQPGKVRLR